MKKRNVAIIAHVDHGKTTLVDEIIKYTHTFRENEDISNLSMDTNDIEKERGITILAKTTSVDYDGYKINILDTPGHADFGGEVERIMKMVDGVLLVVDAYEGPMPQTRFVLKKALEAGCKPIVVINKVDKPTQRVTYVVDEVLELFIELGATDEQIEFKTVYTSAANGTSSLSNNPSDQEKGFKPLMDLIVSEIPEPTGDENAPLQFQPALLDYNDYVGRIGVGKVFNGKIKVGQMVNCIRLDGTEKSFRVQKLFGYVGLKRIEIESATVGDIVAVAGLEDISVGETLTEVGNHNALPILHIDEPTLQMTFGVNTSPFSGKDGKILTSRKIGERLFKETQRDVSLKVEQIDSENFMVLGRGELHLSILIENMRREGFELEVSKPKVIIKEINGVKCEPYEDLQIEITDEYMGGVFEELSQRGAIMGNMTHLGNLIRINYEIPSRGLIGFPTNFMTLTKGYGIMNHTFTEFKPVENINIGERKLGVLVASEEGKATAYSLGGLEDRGTMFVEPNEEVYEGMIVGENARENDLGVNITTAKQMTNVRSATKDQTAVIKTPRILTLEESLEFLDDDEYMEVTPKSIRLRKQILNKAERDKANKRKKKSSES